MCRTFIIYAAVLASVSSNYTPQQVMVDVTNDFGVCVLQLVASRRENAAFSPYGLVSVGLVLYEGANGPTAAEIHNTLRLPWDRHITRIGFRDLHRYLKSYFTNDGFLRGLVLSKPNVILHWNYTRQLQFYGFDLKPADKTTKAPTTTQTTSVEQYPTTIPTAQTTTEQINTVTTLQPSPTNTNTIKATTNQGTERPAETVSISIPTTNMIATETEDTSTKPTPTNAPATNKVTTETELPTTGLSNSSPPVTTITTGTINHTSQGSEGTSTSAPTTNSLTTETEISQTSGISNELSTNSQTTKIPTTEIEISPTEEDSKVTSTNQGEITEKETTNTQTPTFTTTQERKTSTVMEETTKKKSETTPEMEGREDENDMPDVADQTNESSIAFSTNEGTTTESITTTTLVESTTNIKETSGTEQETTKTENVNKVETTTAEGERTVSTITTSNPTTVPLLSDTPTKRTTEVTSEAINTASNNIQTSTSGTVPSTIDESQIYTTGNSGVPLVTTASSETGAMTESITQLVSEKEAEITSMFQMSTNSATNTLEPITRGTESEGTSSTPPLVSENEVEKTSASETPELGTSQISPTKTSGTSGTGEVTTQQEIETENVPIEEETSRRKRAFFSKVQQKRDGMRNWVPQYQDPRWNYHAPLENWFFSYSGGERVPIITYSAYLPFAYLGDLGTLALQLPLDDPRYFMLILLPEDRNGLEKLLYSLQWCPLRVILNQLKTTAVYATVPVFTIVKHINLVPALAKLGILSVFDPSTADLSAMSSEKGIFVRTIEQVVTVSLRKYFGNYGWYEAKPGEVEQHFIANHPFAYFVLDKETQVTLMTGTIVNPITYNQ